MTFSCINNTDVDRFFEAIAYKQAGYTIARIAFVALRVDNVFCILNGGLFMDTGTPRESFRFQSGDVLGGAYQLSELRLDPRQFVEALLKGEISTPEGKLQFRPNEGKTFLASYDPYKQGGSAQTRFDSLTILGGSVEVSQRTQAIYWELKAAPTPYNELHELIAELGLKPVSEKVSFEIVAFQFALVDGISTVTGTEARVALRLARGLEQAKASIGYRVIVQGKVIERRSILGGAMQWRETQEFQQGIAQVEVPAASVLHCVASYRGIAQNHFWIADPTTFANARRVVYEVADSKLEVLTDFLTRPQTRDEMRVISRQGLHGCFGC